MLQDLIYPQQVPDIRKTELIQHWLTQLPQQYDFCRAALEPPLNELAADTGHLAWRIPQEIRHIQARPPTPRHQPEIGLLDHALCARDDIAVPDWVFGHRAGADMVLFAANADSEYGRWVRDQAPEASHFHRVYFQPELLDKGSPRQWDPIKT